MFGTLVFAGLAGLASILSPCVLPLLPVVLGAAVSRHRFGAAALAGGLALSFTIVGLFVATIGFAIGIDGDVVRTVAAILLTAVGVFLVVPRLQTQFAVAAGPVGNWADERLGGFSASGVPGQFGVGLLLGVVWAPCVGPTLGAASTLAARAEDLGQVAATMFVFGVGAALPLLVLGTLSRATMMRVRGRLLATGKVVKVAMGMPLIVVGLLILTGVDKRIETVLVDATPAWLTDFTTRF